MSAPTAIATARPSPREPARPWAAGEVLFDQYTVEALLGAGGMGQVFRVRNELTDTTFAVKRALVASPDDRRQLLSELLTWIDLPSHPNVVACRFFRTVGDEIVLFAEFVEGGTLADWIARKHAEKSATLLELIDLALQTIAAIDLLHARRLVHLDVKPGNVLVTRDGVAKLTDFGLARATAGRANSAPVGGTREYASPEQANGGSAGPASDVFSWAVTVLEMFAGERTWAFGGAALDVLAELEPKANWPAMPSAVRTLLERCFADAPENRPTARAAFDALREVFDAHAERPYARAFHAPPARSVADRRSDRAQALCSRVALGAGVAVPAPFDLPSDASDRARAVADLASFDDVLRSTEHARADAQRFGESFVAALAELFAAKGETHESLDDLGGALQAFDGALSFQKTILAANDVSAKIAVARAVLGKGEIARKRGKFKEAVAWFHSAQPLCRSLGADAQRELARSLFGEGRALADDGDAVRACECFDRAADALERGQTRTTTEGAALLADVLLANAQARASLDDLTEALALTSRAIAFLERTMGADQGSLLTAKRALAYLRHADVLQARNDRDDALTNRRAAIELLEQLVRGGAEEAVGDLASAYLKTSALVDGAEAARLADAAIALVEQFVASGGRDSLAVTLADAYMVRGAQERATGDRASAIGWQSRAIAIYERLVGTRRADVLVPFADARTARWLTMREEKSPGLRAEWERVVALLDEVIAAHQFHALDGVRRDIRLLKPRRGA